ncbi:MAG TPA: AbrB/MazE/SpoVT family DNA-binding domain-containing protein [Candidatus Aenigmarchaeota archaeon]|nr:AbrB/MazE/SpoVT family DNA-binding domain-containing protein [Candidatus Aenigmarchaeota archaeon]
MEIKFKRQLRKSGGSAVVAIPKEVCDAIGIKLDDEIFIKIENKKIILEKA